MTDDPIDAALHALGIPIEPDWLPAIRFHLQLSLRLGKLVSDIPLPDDADPAPVFQP